LLLALALFAPMGEIRLLDQCALPVGARLALLGKTIRGLGVQLLLELVFLVAMAGPHG
jgi:hypothetical protein